MFTEAKVRNISSAAVVGSSSCPFSFDITDQNNRHNLYSDSGGDTPYVLNVLIGNKSFEKYELVRLKQANKSDYHFKLSFSTPVLVANDSYPAVVQGSDWQIAYDAESGMVSNLYLCWCGDKNLALRPGQKATTVPIQYLGSGSSESIVVTAYTCDDRENYSPQSVGGCANGIEFDVQLIPFTASLSAAFVGTSSVLNDNDSTNTLTLRITNSSAQAVSLTPGQSAFEFAFAVEDPTTSDDPSSLLCSSSLYENSSFTMNASSSFFQTPQEAQGDNVPDAVWSVDAADVPGVGIPPFGHVDFTITGVKCDTPAGYTNVFITCLGVAGFEGVVLSARIQKSPLMFPGATGSTYDGDAGVYVKYCQQGDTAESGTFLQMETDNAGLKVVQDGNGKAAFFKAQRGFSLAVGGPADALTVSVDKTDCAFPGVKVVHTGTGPSGFFAGGKGLYVMPNSDDSFVDHGVSLYVKGGTRVDNGNMTINSGTMTVNPTASAGLIINAPGAARISQSSSALAVNGGSTSLVSDGTHSALEVTGTTQLTGDVEITGNLTVSQGTITLTGTDGTTVILVAQASPSGDNKELAIKDDTSQGIANLRCHALRNEGWFYLGANDALVLKQASSNTGSKLALEVATPDGTCDCGNIHVQDAWSEGGTYIAKDFDHSNFSMLTYKSSPSDDDGGGLQLTNYYSGSANDNWAQGAVDTQS